VKVRAIERRAVGEMSAIFFFPSFLLRKRRGKRGGRMRVRR